MGNISFSHLISGKQSLFDWIMEHMGEDGILKESLPDEQESLKLSNPNLSGLSFMDGVLDNFMSEDSENSADTLLNMFLEFVRASPPDLSIEEIDSHLGRIYKFIIEHNTITYIDDFLADLYEKATSNTRLLSVCMVSARRFLLQSPHREAIKFGLAIFGILKLSDEELKTYILFGHSDEFAVFVAIGLKRENRNDIIFDLMKKTKGRGRIEYLNKLDIDSQEKREWVIFEGYKCDMGIDHIVLDYLSKVDLLDYIKENGFNQKLYDVLSDIIGSFSGFSKVSLGDYEYSKELVTLFLRESKNQKMNMERFASVCSLMSYVNNNEFNDFIDAEKQELIKIIEHIAWEGGIDWEGLVRSNPFDYNARTIAKTLKFDIWDEQFNIALKKEHFDDWFPLTLTNSKQQYMKLCELVEKRFDLQSLKKGPQDELGLNRKFSVYDDLSMIAQNLKSFNEIIGVEIVDTLLQSPLTRARNIALNVVESWQEKIYLQLEIPEIIFQTIENNLKKEPNKDVLTRYTKILHTQGIIKRKETKMRLAIHSEYNGSAIYSLGTLKSPTFAPINYENLELPKNLINDFEQWQEVFNKYILQWCDSNVKPLEKEFEALCEAKKIQLAKQLKAFFKNQAYIECHTNNAKKEIYYFYVKISENTPYILWDEDNNGVDIKQFQNQFKIYKREAKMLLQDLQECCDTLLNQDCKMLNNKARKIVKKLNKFMPYCHLAYRTYKKKPKQASLFDDL